MKKQLNPDLMLIIVAVIWGTGFIATEYAIDAGFGALIIMAGRFSIAALTLLIFTFKDLKKITKKEWLKGSIAGVFLFLGFFFQTFGQSMTTVSNSAFLTATNVVFVPFIAWLLTKHRPEKKVFLLALMTFIGVAVLTVNITGGISMNIGDLYVFICAIMFATHIAYLSLAVDGSNPLSITFIQITVAALLALIGLMIFGTGDLSSADYAMGIPSILFLGLFSTCLCFFMQTSAQKRTTPGKTGIILSTESLFGTVFAVVLGIEPLTTKIIVGGLIIISAVVLTEVKPSSAKKIVSYD